MQRRRLKRTVGESNVYAESLRNPTAYVTWTSRRDPKQIPKIGNGVGYCRPPVHSQFKPGRSGYPLGRPVGSKNLRTAVEGIFTDKITIRVGSRVRKVTRLEAVLLTNLNQALKGDPRAIRAVNATATTLGLMDERPQKLVLGDLSSFTMTELEEFRRLLKKANGRIVPQ